MSLNVKSPRKSPKKPEEIFDLASSQRNGDEDYEFSSSSSDEDEEFELLFKKAKKRKISASDSTTLKYLSKSKKKVSNNLFAELGFSIDEDDVKKDTQANNLSTAQKFLLERVTEERKINEFAKQDELAKEAEQHEKIRFDPIINSQICKEFRDKPENASYINSIKENLKLNNEYKILDFHFIKSKGCYGQTQKFDKKLNLIFDKNVMFYTNERMLKQLLNQFDVNTVIDRLLCETSMEVVNEFPTSLMKTILPQDLNFDKLTLGMGLDATLLKQGKKKSDVTLILDSMEELPSPLLTTYKLNKLFQLFNLQKNGDKIKDEVKILNRWLFSTAVYLMVDTRVNICEDIKDHRTTCIDLLNGIIVKLAKRLGFHEITGLIDQCLPKHLELTYRLIDNLKNRTLKMSLLLRFIAETGFNDISDESRAVSQYDEVEKMIEKEINDQVSRDDATIYGFYRLLEILSQSKLNRDELLLYKSGPPNEVQNEYKINIREYNLIRCRIRAICDFIYLALPMVVKKENINMRIKKQTGDVKGLDDNWYYAHAILKSLKIIKRHYFTKFENSLVVPTITDCSAILTSTVSKLETDLKISMDIFDE
ncbi:unnamed protein product [Ambrosiozyma monospora]|uniref:Unnamed protein product n=1 Tax=Ambrosiozyma monospora TaxID=43982 RepID=A0A9W7DI58_AMBMO|nr:unnamed protein product [Ambrosiozyma monospora]